MAFWLSRTRPWICKAAVFDFVFCLVNSVARQMGAKCTLKPPFMVLTHVSMFSAVSVKLSEVRNWNIENQSSYGPSVFTFFSANQNSSLQVELRFIRFIVNCTASKMLKNCQMWKEQNVVIRNFHLNYKVVEFHNLIFQSQNLCCLKNAS